MTGILDSLINGNKESDSENNPENNPEISHDFVILPILRLLALKLWPTKRKKPEIIGNRPKSGSRKQVQSGSRGRKARTRELA